MSGMCRSISTASNAPVAGERDRGRAIRRDGRRVAEPLQQRRADIAVDRIVVDQQHGERSDGASRLDRRRRLRGARERHRELERAAGAGRALDRELAAHQPREPARDRQAQTGAAEAARDAVVGLHEILEDALVHRRRDADAGVADRDAQQRPALRRRRVAATVIAAASR